MLNWGTAMNNVNGKTWRIIAVILTVLIVSYGAVYGYGRLNGRFEAVETQVKKINENENAIIGMQKDIEYIKEAVDRIEKKL